MKSKYIVSFVDIVNNFFGMEWMGEAHDEVSALVKAERRAQINKLDMLQTIQNNNRKSNMKRYYYNPVGTEVRAGSQLGVLEEDEMRAKCPSMFAEEPFEEVSDEYSFIPTHRIVKSLSELGYVPVQATQSYVRPKSNKQGFQSHQVRLLTETTW